MNTKMNTATAKWMTETDRIEARLKECNKGKVSVYGRSFGGRPLYKISYGDPEVWTHVVNYNSAVAANDLPSYKTRANGKPHILIFAAIHGMEIEGTAALMGLIDLLEGEHDWPGFSRDQRVALLKLSERVTMTLIPVSNPDGRDRHKEYHWCCGMSFDELRYIMQGSWQDGELCGWPGCKRVHPMTPDKVGHLGAYFNDQGVNPMHDAFPLMKAPENVALFELVDEERPDYILSLHGGTNTINSLTWPRYVAPYCVEFNARLSKAMTERGESRGIPFADIFAGKDLHAVNREDNHSFNLVSALHNFSGANVLLYESNQGLDMPDTVSLTPDEIMESHGVLFQTLLEEVLANQ